MPYNTLFCKIFKCTSHATLRISCQNKVQKSQPQIVQVDVDIDGRCLKDHYCYTEYNENGDAYEDVLEALIEKQFRILLTIGNSSV